MNNVNFSSVGHILKPSVNMNQKQNITPYQAQQNFASILKDSISKVNEAQVQSDVVTEKLARGENVDLHQVMIASQKASVTMTATLEIRNKVVEAYQEMMRMQV